MPPKPTDAEKQALQEAYQQRRPTRVPLRWNANSRVILLNPEHNPEGWDYETYFNDPTVHLTVQARGREYFHTVLGAVSDMPSDLPEQWPFLLELQNVYDAAWFGAKVEFRPGQVPDTRPAFSMAEAEAFIARDFSKPLDAPWLRDRIAFHKRLVKEAETFTHLGRKGVVAPLGMGFDGPLTVAVNLFGQEVFTYLALDPDLMRRLLETITRACIARTQAIAREFGGGWNPPEFGGLADDCVQMIGTDMYEEAIAPIHEMWYRETSATTPADDRRGIHLCGDATRHFKTIRERLGVVSFDTGFPVDFGWLREELGDDVEISGGPHIALLKDGTPDQCAERAREILQSGIMRGGRFILQEGNNLPPCVPVENLAAVYDACLEYGRYET